MVLRVCMGGYHHISLFFLVVVVVEELLSVRSHVRMDNCLVVGEIF